MWTTCETRESFRRQMPSLEGPLVKLILTVKACKTMQLTRTTSRGLLAKTTRKIC